MPTKSNNTGGRGGKRPGAGRKKAAVKEKAENGNPGGRDLTVLDIPEVEGVQMPKPHDLMKMNKKISSYFAIWSVLNQNVVTKIIFL